MPFYAALVSIVVALISPLQRILVVDVPDAGVDGRSH